MSAWSPRHISDSLHHCVNRVIAIFNDDKSQFHHKTVTQLKELIIQFTANENAAKRQANKIEWDKCRGQILQYFFFYVYKHFTVRVHITTLCYNEIRECSLWIFICEWGNYLRQYNTVLPGHSMQAVPQTKSQSTHHYGNVITALAFSTSFWKY